MTRRRAALGPPSSSARRSTGLVPYEPGKPAETVQRELGLERVVKLASNEGPFGPFPEAIEAIAGRFRVEPLPRRRAATGCARRSRSATRSAFEEVVVAAGADAVIGYVCQATLDPGDEIVTPWPSFPSYVLDPLKLRRRPRCASPSATAGRHGRDARRGDGADEARVPADREQPDGDDDLARRRARVPRRGARPRAHRRRRGVLRVRRRAGFPDAIEEAASAAGTCSRCGPSRRSTGSRACGSGTASAPLRDRGDPQGAPRVRRDHPRRRRPPREPRRAGGARSAPRREPRGDGRARVGPARARASSRSRPRSGTSSSWTSNDAAALNDALLRRGVIVRPMGPFGAPTALRITAGTPEEIAFLAEQPRRAVFSNGLTSPQGPSAGVHCAARRRPRSMWTTLKRGVGRGAATADRGGGPSVALAGARRDLPAAARGAAERRRSSCGSSAGRPLVLAVLVGGTAGGAYLYLHESVAAVAPKSVEVKKALKALDVPLPGQPATALVIGYDRRADEAEDAVPLGHADARPRRPGREDDLDAVVPPRPAVEVHCPGQATYVDKINAAYSTCGAAGRSRDRRQLTGLPINYIITVNFRGFRQLVDRLGGVWMDIDRRYFNDHGGPTGYAKINLSPATSASRAWGARLRPLPPHRLGPLPQRAAAALRPRVQGSDRVRVLDDEAAAGDQGDHLERRGRPGGGRTSPRRRSCATRALAYSLPPGTSSSRASTGSRASPTSTTAQENIDRAVREFRTRTSSRRGRRPPSRSVRS